MSHPLPTTSFTVRPDEVEALAAELGTLASELADDADWTRSAAASFPVALGGHEGWNAGVAANAWVRLQEILAARAGALAGTLSAAAAAYRAEDAALAGRSGHRPGPR
ncbi:hypothetical protein [Blastococcus sp. CT_GayMR16]|uniref:hypothetical protein n=1 Tax=Blastococcus sp. CT_GayMR16 TaxID=2559607 RepID=UPI0010736093|nr:hypothetical protein [Blastococcus sp. CT_GayMR16]TFV90556.1 hypothetical protein E4P38_03815 [Blastococcus sp. CT_GayMR16]